MRRIVLFATLMGFCSVSLGAVDKEKKPKEDSKKAAATRKLLKTKISADFSEVKLSEIVDELKEKVPGLKFRIDNKGGVSNNQTLSFKGDDKTVEEVLDGLFKKVDLGYVVINNSKDAYDGLVMIKKGKERGYPAGD